MEKEKRLVIKTKMKFTFYRKVSRKNRTIFVKKYLGRKPCLLPVVDLSGVYLAFLRVVSPSFLNSYGKMSPGACRLLTASWY